MPAAINLQRNSEVFFSTVDLLGGAAVTAMTPSNTWKVEVLAGFAASASASTQDIIPLESGTNPDRSQQRFMTNIEPASWNFQVYLRPTGVVTGAANNGSGAGTNTSGNVKPVADWFLWQALISNTKPSTGTVDQSVWITGGKFPTTNVAASTGAHSSRTNFGSMQENQMYMMMDNVIYQISNVAVSKATVDAGIDSIATVTWTGNGTTMAELIGAPRNNAVSVFGGVLNSGTAVTANSNALALSAIAAYHPWATMNVAGVQVTNTFIKNRLSAVSITHASSALVSANTYTFPVTALTFDWDNNVSYLTPEEMFALNNPIGQFTGARTVSGSVNMYLRGGDSDSAQFLRNIYADARTSSSQTTTANLIIGGLTAPYVAFYMPAVAFDFPQITVEDVLGLSVNFLAQETTANRGNGGEVTIVAVK